MVQTNQNGDPSDREPFGGRDGTATPQWLFDWLNQQVKAETGQPFQLDAAASDWSAKCANYFDEQMDALQQDWTRWPTIFLNPPFMPDLIEQFLAKALEAAAAGSTVVMILPAWPRYEWYHDVRGRGRVQEVVGPVAFERRDGTKVRANTGHNGFNVFVLTLGPHITPGTIGEPIQNPSARPREPAAASEGARAKPRKDGIRRLSEVAVKATEWLWHNRIPMGELSILDGDPGVNKSSFLLDLAARVSTGRSMPDGTAGILGGVLLLMAEDSIPKTIIQRLQAAGADLSRIAVPERALVIPRDLDLITNLAGKVHAALIVIDPLMAFLTVDTNGDQKVRQALTPLRDLAEALNVAVVFSRHLTKRGGGQALYRGGGSIAILGATRSGLLVAKAPDEPNQRVLCHIKSNLGPLAPSLLFEPVSGENGIVQIEWRGECDYTPEDVLSPPKPGDSRLAEAILFLRDLLGRGPVKQGEAKEKALAAGLAYRTVERAKEVLGVVSERRGWGPGSTCYWSLPPETTLAEDSGPYYATRAGVADYEPESDGQISGCVRRLCRRGQWPRR